MRQVGTPPKNVMGRVLTLAANRRGGEPPGGTVITAARWAKELCGASRSRS
jgi:hypothetical protein